MNENCEMPVWFDGKHVDEVAFARELLARKDMRCVNGRLYTMEGLVEEDMLLAGIGAELSPWISRNFSATVASCAKTLKILSACRAPAPQLDRLHFRNGTLLLRSGFTPQREWAMNRLPVDYDPDAPEPVRWQQFLGELLAPEDRITLQEYLGYCLLPSTQGQVMLLLIGSGGEGKSRITAVLRALLGSNMNLGSIGKLESDKFCPAEQEGKLLFLDDDIRMEALTSTTTIKTIVTCDGQMEMERKGRQSFQGQMYARLLCMGNGSLKSLHDRSQGFYRRQIILQTLPRPEGRVDDPYLKDKLLAELPGITMWCLEGLYRLLGNDFRFTISDHARAAKQELIQEDNNIISFLSSSGYVTLDPKGQTTAAALYDTYRRWCADNAELELRSGTFFRYLTQNSAAHKLENRRNIPTANGKRVRGYAGIRICRQAEAYERLPDSTYVPFRDAEYA